ncbi:carbohydrate ABC transporter permease [Compostimonas suwonensis]|uniref:Multiple sugar transport system permease protein n=1 Tax=Compostimonas suwonensis TaxID=1048394 RepID=A0A2M9C4N9_9MICO|nr:carbohydrate ABC transporter permease [Compostimonas suwonensis]PJJ65493.1 multiple sugar transport system permease protein [Compostimonas suwonensis]
MTATATTPTPRDTSRAASGREDAAVLRQRRRRSRRSPFRDRKSAVLTITLFICAIYFLFPLYWLVVAATKSNGDLFSTFGLWFSGQFNLFDNIATVFTFQDGIFSQWALNTLLYSGVSAVGATFLATLGGYAFAKYEFRGGKILFSAVLGSIMIPASALAIPTYLVFAQIGFVNTPWAIIIPSLVNPFGLYLMRVYAQDAVPVSLMEAARIDGAGEFRIFWQVATRLLTPGIVTVFLFSLVATWNNYFLPLIMLNDQHLYPLTVGLAQWQALSASGSGSQALFSTVITGSLISIVPLVVAFLYLQRFWQSGLATGGTKG